MIFWIFSSPSWTLCQGSARFWAFLVHLSYGRMREVVLCVMSMMVWRWWQVPVLCRCWGRILVSLTALFRYHFPPGSLHVAERGLAGAHGPLWSPAPCCDLKLCLWERMPWGKALWGDVGMVFCWPKPLYSSAGFRASLNLGCCCLVEVDGKDAPKLKISQQRAASPLWKPYFTLCSCMRNLSLLPSQFPLPSCLCSPARHRRAVTSTEPEAKQSPAGWAERGSVPSKGWAPSCWGESAPHCSSRVPPPPGLNPCHGNLGVKHGPDFGRRSRSNKKGRGEQAQELFLREEGILWSVSIWLVSKHLPRFVRALY